MKNDQWFEPGNKVMRVSCVHPKTGVAAENGLDRIPYGRVFCVKSCFIGLQGLPLMMLVGVSLPPHLEGIHTHNFRKVEEIKLCVAAAKQAEKKTQVKEGAV